MNDLDPGVFEFWQMSLRVAARGFDDLDPTIDDGVDIFRIRRFGKRWQERKIDPKRLVGHFVAARDFLGKVLGRALGEPSDNPKAARV